MESESIVSIELAVGAAALVLAARLISIVQATRGVPAAHRFVVDALASGDVEQLKSKTRGLGYKNPYGEVAGQLLQANARDATTSAERSAILDRATENSKRRFQRRSQQSQAMDLVALIVAVGIVAFARDGLPTGPLFWTLAGAVMLLLLFSVVARAQLTSNVIGSLEALRSVLIARPQLPSLSGGPVDCFWCGEKTEQRSYDIVDIESQARGRVLATVCESCGKFVTTLSGDDMDSSLDPVSSD